MKNMVNCYLIYEVIKNKISLTINVHVSSGRGGLLQIDIEVTLLLFSIVS